MRVPLGLLLLSLAGCGPSVPTIVEVDRPVFVTPPSACLAPIEWDREADPATNGDLWKSWLGRAHALDLAGVQFECIRGWAEDMAKLAPQGARVRTKGKGD
jgi:hypothetical protein